MSGYRAKESIAAVGISCRFAGATSLSELERNLCNAPELSSPISDNYFNADGFYQPDAKHHGSTNVCNSYFLDGNIRHFDNGFFNTTALEAAAMDPQQRLLLETVYETLKNSGTPVQRLKGSDTAVYVGLMCGDYENILMRDIDSAPKYQAVQALRSGETQLAIVGGSNVSHGTGTPTGDPVEAKAIHAVFGSADSELDPDRTPTPLYVGSVKTVIGHTEGTAGLAGVTKATLAFQSGRVFPNKQFRMPQPSHQAILQRIRNPNVTAMAGAGTWPAPVVRRSLGFFRTAFWEIPDLRVRSIDFVDGSAPDASVIAESLLELETAEKVLASSRVEPEPEPEPEPPLWSDEREVRYCHGRFEIPRLVANVSLDNKYNASRRAVYEKRGLTNVRLSPRAWLEERTAVSRSSLAQREVLRIQVAFSTAFPIPVVRDGLVEAYLVIGRAGKKRRQVLALSSDCAKTVDVSACSVIDIEKANKNGLKKKKKMHRVAGTSVKVLSADVASESSLLQAYKDIRSSMPAIAGFPGRLRPFQAATKQVVFAGPNLVLEAVSIPSEQVPSAMERLAGYNYQLDKGKSFRIILAPQSSTEHHLMFGFYHMNMDGISLQVLISEVDRCYGGELLTSSPLQYLDFCQRQRDALQNGDWGEDLRFWEKTLAQTPVELPEAKENLSLGDCELEVCCYQGSKAAYDISLDMIDSGDLLTAVRLAVQDSLYSKKDVELLLSSFFNLVESLASSAGQGIPLDRVSIFGADASSEALQLGRGQSRLLEVWLEVLPTPANTHVHRGSDFFHSGGNSLLLVVLQQKIQQTFAVSLPLVSMFDSSTLEDMSRLIDNKSADHVQLDWDSETSPALHFGAELARAETSAGPMLSAPSSRRARSGYTRATWQRPDALGPFLSSSKVRIHTGDLAAARLGLSPQTARSIFSEAHAVVHSGADVLHMKSYSTIREANLGSTVQLVRMCVGQGRLVPLHFVSTVSVSLYSGLDAFGGTSTAAFPPSSDGSDGYTASKWASERFLERLIPA
ncbi:uncharacterized protein PpBr36_10612 [Pyricularia pennisetigena]|uniref:uncharacterized protein n=1 Tax=Pyricularia pennisetigena TaxID=1578925 RepID=UPI00114DC640|nr:uncharacterized protein PpBr36_10612 [Pyricularia pennisetigena]TLS21208.1 hypothetical protein PpBr36_10612 [Pyricularia pennisetigena]